MTGPVVGVREGIQSNLSWETNKKSIQVYFDRKGLGRLFTYTNSLFLLGLIAYKNRKICIAKWAQKKQQRLPLFDSVVERYLKLIVENLREWMVPIKIRPLVF